MKQYENEDLPNISMENFANLFNVYLKPDNVWTYSINKGVYFNNIDNYSPNNFTYYEVKEEDQWATIAYQFYENIELWWVICKINGITDPALNLPLPGDRLIILNKDIVDAILFQIRGT